MLAKEKAAEEKSTEQVDPIDNFKIEFLDFSRMRSADAVNRMLDKGMSYVNFSNWVIRYHVFICSLFLRICDQAALIFSGSMMNNFLATSVTFPITIISICFFIITVFK